MNRIKNFDLYLVMLTAAGFAAIGLVMGFATIEHFKNTLADPSWSQTQVYFDYVSKYNRILMPLIMFEILLLAICIPRRFLRDKALLISSGVILILSVILFLIGGALLSMTVILIFSLVTQLVTLVIFLLRYSAMRFLKVGKTAQFGSMIAHLGILLFIIDVIAVKDLADHLTIFWIATLLIVCGFFLLFYPDIFKRRSDQAR